MIPTITDRRKLPICYRAVPTRESQPRDEVVELARENYRALYHEEPGRVLYYAPEGGPNYYVLEMED